MRIASVLLCLALPCAVAQAEIYKHVDEQGRVTYSNSPIKGAKKLELEPLSTVEPPAAAKPKTPPPASFPKVDARTQQQRDAMRRKILEEELAAEEKLLAEARQNLTEGEAVRLGSEKNYQRYLDRIQGLKDNVALHEKNVAALRKELEALR